MIAIFEDSVKRIGFRASCELECGFHPNFGALGRRGKKCDSSRHLDFYFLQGYVVWRAGGMWLRSGLAFNTGQIVFTSMRDGTNEIYVMFADGRNQVRLTNHPTYDFDPDWSPDGTKIAFVSTRVGNGFKIFVMDADGKNPIRLTDERSEKHPDWSPDGGKIAFTVLPGKENLAPHIAVMDADGNNRVRHEDHAMEPSWSPDGGEIAFVSSRHGNNEIYVIGADGQGLKRVTRDLAPKYRPAWSPDGERIAYYSWHERFDHIYVVDTDGKNRTRLTHNQEHHSEPAWSPDGRTIAYVTSKDDFRTNPTIHLMTADGKYLKQISDVHDTHDFQPDFNPVGLSVSLAPNKITIWGRLKKLAPNFR